MEFDNAFEVPLPPAEAWKLLLDIEGIAPCMPGAELTEVLGNNTYKGKISVRLGPVALTFAGVVKVEDIDNEKHTARVAAQGTDAKGRGGAQAASVFRLEPAGTGCKVLVHTNLNLSGAVAQYGRGVGIIQATSTQLMNQFAKCLKEKLAQGHAAPPRLRERQNRKHRRSRRRRILRNRRPPRRKPNRQSPEKQTGTLGHSHRGG